MQCGSVASVLTDSKSAGFQILRSSRGLIKFGMDVLHGLDHLHANNIIHRDLASRMIVISFRFDVVARQCAVGRQRKRSVD